MQKIVKSLTLFFVALVIVIIPAVIHMNPEISAASEEINPEYIADIYPANDTVAYMDPTFIAAFYSYRPGATYASSTIILDGKDVTTFANPDSNGFSFVRNLPDGYHTVKVTLVDNLSNVSVRVWTFGVDNDAPTSHAYGLPQYSSTAEIMVPVEGSDSFSHIQNTELWVQKNGGSWSFVTSVFGIPNSIYFDSSSYGYDGYYSFATIATDVNGNQETKSFNPEASTLIDTIAPSQISRDKIVIEQKTTGYEDAVYCLPGSFSADVARVSIFSDINLSNKLVDSAIFLNDSSFRCGAYGIGDNKYSKVYFVTYDAAGNSSIPTMVENNFSVGTAPSNLNIEKVDSTTVKIKWTQGLGAKEYRIKYRQVGESNYSNYISLQPILNNATISNLDSNKDYEFAVSTIDYHGNESSLSTMKFRIIPKAVVRATTATATSTSLVTPTTSKTEVKTPDKTSPTEETKPDDTAKTDDTTKDETKKDDTENGEVKGDSTTTNTNDTTKDETSRNWTPWIVLAILIILAGAATGGYFYWFGGPEEITTTVKTEEPKEKTEAKDKTNDKDQEARW